MTGNVYLEVGEARNVLDACPLPPLGARIMVDAALTDGNVAAVVEVTGHEWRAEASVDEDRRDGYFALSVTIKTKGVTTEP